MATSAVPSYVWTALLTEATGHTGYSHQSGVTGADFRPDMVMASADTLDQAEAFWSDDVRTFRVIDDVADVVAGDRGMPCPASKEAGEAYTQCEPNLRHCGAWHRRVPAHNATT